MRNKVAFEIGDKVEWARGHGTGTGKILQIYTEDVTKTLKGTKVSRNDSEENPACLIEQSDGDQVLKATPEISGA